MKHFVFWLWIGFTIFVGVAAAHEQTPKASKRPVPNSKNVIAKFAVAREGDLMLIPVVIGESEYQFLLDTGSVANVLSTSLVEKLGPLKRSARPSPKGFPPMYEMPEATLAGTNLSVTGDAAKVDLTPLCRASGHDIQGMLGMTFLKDHVIELDFDAGSVAFLNAAPKTDAKTFPLDRDPFGRGTVRLEVLPKKSIPFLIDTGMASPGVGEMTAALFDELLEAERLKVMSPKIKSLTVGGVVSNRKGQLDVFRLGEFEHRNLRVSDGTVNGLGLFYLARYKVTLDFVGDQVYFERGKHFSAPSLFDASGMILSRSDGKTFVDRVQPDEPAFVAGIREDDVLTHFNGERANGLSLFTIRQSLSRIDETVRLSFERSGESRECQLLLKNWQNAILAK